MRKQGRSTGATLWLVIALLILAANLGRVHRWYSGQQRSAQYNSISVPEMQATMDFYAPIWATATAAAKDPGR